MILLDHNKCIGMVLLDVDKYNDPPASDYPFTCWLA